MNTFKYLRKLLCTATMLSAGCVLLLSSQLTHANESSAERQATQYPNTAKYTIRRKGKKVGTHFVKFSQNDLGLKVDVESKITITILKVPVFKFNYVASEQWEDGKLTSVNARTNNGGEITKAEYTPDKENPDAFSSNHWNADVLAATKVFNTLTGKINQVSIDTIGREVLKDDRTSINATRYRYSGDFQADVWYDDTKRWVKLEFKGEDGNVITYTANPLHFQP